MKLNARAKQNRAGDSERTNSCPRFRRAISESLVGRIFAISYTHAARRRDLLSIGNDGGKITEPKPLLMGSQPRVAFILPESARAPLMKD